MSFLQVATLEDLWSGEMMGVEANGEPILLVNIDNRIYAYADACPHQKSRLSEGTLNNNIIRCATHHWEFDVCTGCGVNPQNASLRVFPIRIDGQNILVETDAVTPLAATAGGGNEQ